MKFRTVSNIKYVWYDLDYKKSATKHVPRHMHLKDLQYRHIAAKYMPKELSSDIGLANRRGCPSICPSTLIVHPLDGVSTGTVPIPLTTGDGYNIQSTTRCNGQDWIYLQSCPYNSLDNAIIWLKEGAPIAITSAPSDIIVGCRLWQKGSYGYINEKIRN